MNYALHIDAFSPETIPMARLADYMAGLAELLGQKESVHFVQLETGSTRIVARVDEQSVPEITKNLAALSDGAGSAWANRAWTKINQMLSEDSVGGRLVQGGNGDGGGGVVIEFPGANAPRPDVLGPIKQIGSLQGTLMRIGGTDSTVPMILQNGSMTYSNINCDRTTARELARCLFEPVRVFGEGRWRRESNGDWKLISFRVSRFERLKQTTIKNAIEDIHRKHAREKFDDSEDLSIDQIVQLRRD